MNDPLAALRDIHLPADPSWWPLAWGWWLLAAGILLLVGAVIWWWHDPRRKHYRQGEWALRLLRDDLHLRTDPQAYSAAVSRLLKRYALLRYGRPGVAGLAGSRWQSFLHKTGGAQAFTDGDLEDLSTAAYRRGGTAVDRQQITERAFAWLKNSRRRHGV